MLECGLAREIVPELFDDRLLWDAALARVGYVAKRQAGALALGALLLDLPGTEIRRIVRRWGGSNELSGLLCWFAEHRDDWARAADMPLCDFKRLMAHANFNDLRVLWRFQERQATGADALSRRIARRAAAIPPAAVAPPPLLGGADLKRMGLPEGPRLGSVLRALYDAQLNEELTTRRQARKLAQAIIGRE